jgi:hypothetical protein
MWLLSRLFPHVTSHPHSKPDASSSVIDCIPVYQPWTAPPTMANNYSRGLCALSRSVWKQRHMQQRTA